MISIRTKIVFTTLLVLAFLLFISPFFIKKIALGSLPIECLDQNLSPNECVNYLNKKVSDLESQVNTLSSQIAVMDNQIALTEARIVANNKQISDLTLDIDTTDKKINGLQQSLDDISQALISRIVSTYEIGTIQPLHVLLSSDDASNFLSRLNYLKIAQGHDRKLILETAAAKNDYSNQKNILEEKKKQIEALKNQAEAYSAQLDEQKQAKNDLLVATQNDEKKYELLRDQAERELAALAGSQFAEKKEVKRGDPIGLMGSTGFSSGPHLHFGYYNLSEKEHNEDFKNNIGWYSTRDLDPRTSLENRSLQSYDSSCPSPMGSGSFIWPLGNPYITQCYGSTPYSSVYSNGLHDGLDMATNGSITVTAAEDGIAYFYRGSTSFGNNVRIFHSNGRMSLYLHLK